MSDPSRRFERLSIDTNQPVKKAQRAIRGNTQEQQTADSDPDMAASISEAYGSSTRSSIPGRSGLTYDLTGLPPLIQKRAASSITTNYSVRNCKATASAFVFEVNDPPSPVSLTSNGMTCLCSEYKDDGGKACRHIFVSSAERHF